MIVYRITLAKFARKLSASGNPARWNSKDVKVIYTAGSRSLACLENVVHRSSMGLKENFKVIQVEIPDNLRVEEIKISELDPQWREYSRYPDTQKIGDEWIKNGRTAVLKVPSAIIPEEHNFLINPLHKDFKRIKYLGSEPFDFDDRIKASIP
ncbi:MAG TPA: RES family NAD+ phosphorylase [Chitinophagaceae bacterium]